MKIGRENNIPELWKDVPGYEGWYQASDRGRIKSLSRSVQCSGRYKEIRKYRERILRQWVFWKKTIRGREISALGVDLSKNNQMQTKSVHRLIALTFLGPCPEGLEVCHNDGDPTNNRLDNLRYDTHVGNEADKILHGTDNRAENIKGVNYWTGKGCHGKRRPR